MSAPGAKARALACYQAVPASHPDNLESLKWAVHLAAELGRRQQQMEYLERLARAEQAQVRSRNVAASITCLCSCEGLTGDSLISRASVHFFLFFFLVVRVWEWVLLSAAYGTTGQGGAGAGAVLDFVMAHFGAAM